MLVTILSWIYIFAVCICIGTAAAKVLSHIIPVPERKLYGTTGVVVTGLVVLAVYAEVFSIFYKVGALCHIIMLLAASCGAYFCRGEISSIFKELSGRMSGNSKRCVLYIIIILGAAFFTSRGEFHTDTGIYHAQAIRLIEEYGVLKGLGNLQLHFAYNSAYLPLCALFTLSFILPYALHTMTGFFMVLFTIFALEGLMEFGSHKRHGGDFARVAVIIYSLTCLTGLQSPATDYGTMFMTLYILCAWITYAEEKSSFDGGRTDIAYYGYLAVLSIFTVSMKLSAAVLVLLAILPFVLIVKKKMWKELICFLVIGFLSFLPYMIRNVIISGWLFYPVEAIDLFDVVWKIPVEYMRHDSAQIKVWGRCLYDVGRLNEGPSSWLPAWWSEKAHYEEMLIYSQFVGAALLAVSAVLRFKEKKFNSAVFLFYITVIGNIGMWFITAPFIRYGLAFLLLLPLCALGDVLDSVIDNKNIPAIVFSLLVLVNFCSWIDNYFTEDMVFVKHHLLDGYYINPIPFEESEMTPMDMDGLTVYVAGLSEVNSYYVFPSSCYDQMVERTELIGDSFLEGFKAK